MSIDRVRADHEAEKIREYEEQKAKEAAELNLPMNPSFNPMAPPSTQGGLPDSQPIPTHKPILTQSASNMNKAIEFKENVMKKYIKKSFFWMNQ